VDGKCRTRKWRTKKEERTENAGLKMEDQKNRNGQQPEADYGM